MQKYAPLMYIYLEYILYGNKQGAKFSFSGINKG